MFGASLKRDATRRLFVVSRRTESSDPPMASCTELGGPRDRRHNRERLPREVKRHVGQVRGVLAERVVISTVLDPFLDLRGLSKLRQPQRAEVPAPRGQSAYPSGPA